MYRRTKSKWLKHLDFMILDCFCLELAFHAAIFLRNGHFDLLKTDTYRSISVILLLIELLVLFFNETFRNVLKRGFYKELSITIKHSFFLLTCLAMYLVFTKQSNEVSRLIFLNTFLFYVLLSYGVRLLWKWFIFKTMNSRLTINKRSLVIVTTGDIVEAVVNKILSRNYNHFFIKGIFLLNNKENVENRLEGIPIFESEDSILNYVKKEWVDEVFINIPSQYPICVDLANHFIEMGITVHLKLNWIEHYAGRKQFVEKLSDYTVFTTSINVASNRQIVFKRIVDIIGGIIGCGITCLLLLFIGPIIYIQDPGPIFYSQERIGKNGKRFKIYKFRSMIMNADELKQSLMKENRIKDGLMFKMEKDPRIIGGEHGIGQFIRKMSLDEFPQFWNVLKGEMSLVGTRPPTPDEWERYEFHHRARLAFKPGITGLWQVSGRSQITDFEEVVKLDTKYITEWTMGLDFRILFKTILVVLGKEGSM